MRKKKGAHAPPCAPLRTPMPTMKKNSTDALYAQRYASICRLEIDARTSTEENYTLVRSAVKSFHSLVSQYAHKTHSEYRPCSCNIIFVRKHLLEAKSERTLQDTH